MTNDNVDLKPGLAAAAAYIRMRAETLKYQVGGNYPQARKREYHALAAEIEALEKRAPITEDDAK